MAESTDYKIGIIKEISKKISSSGFHEKFDKENKTFFMFNIEFEDGVKGTSSSLDADGKYKNGDKVKYGAKETKKGLWISIKNKVDEEGKSAFKSDYNDIGSIKRQAMASCLELSDLAYEIGKKEPKSKKSIYSYAAYFYEWMIRDVTKRDELFNRKAALKEAIMMTRFSTLNMIEEGKTQEHIFEAAEEMMKMINSISNDESGK
jgi:hypothetical protein